MSENLLGLSSFLSNEDTREPAPWSGPPTGVAPAGRTHACSPGDGAQRVSLAVLPATTVSAGRAPVRLVARGTPAFRTPLECDRVERLYGLRATKEEAVMGLIERTREILLHPKTQWQVIASEPASTAALYTRVIMPLAAIGPVASLIGWSVFGIPVPFAGTYRVPLSEGFAPAVVRYVLGLCAVFVLALIIDGLAPSFGGEKNQVQALKVAAFSSTAVWLAGIFALVPSVSVLGVVGVYSLYLLYAGLPIVMKAPPDKALGYTVVVIVSACVLFVVIGVIATRFAATPFSQIPGM